MNPAVLSKRQLSISQTIREVLNMNAVSKIGSADVEDINVLIKTILDVDPKAKTESSACYRTVRDRLIGSGWTTQRFNEVVFTLKVSGRLFVSRSRKTISFKPFFKSVKKDRCVYCDRVSKNLTKDHVVPKSKGGRNDPTNIVWACRPCNLSKADRTPTEWARDILRFQKRAA